MLLSASSLRSVTKRNNASRRVTGRERPCARREADPTTSSLRAQAAQDAFDERRAGTVDHGPAITRIWAEGLARLDPNQPPANAPPPRWRRFIDDNGRFLGGLFPSRAAALGWGPLDLFGCDQPFARLIGRGFYGCSTARHWLSCQTGDRKAVSATSKRYG